MTQSLPWQPDENSNSHDIASVNYAGTDLYLYAAGFREAVETLLASVRSGGHGQDLLVYPIVYNLRHAIELLLKQVIYAARRLLDNPGDFPDTHRFVDLWNTCRPLLQRIWPRDTALETVERTVLGLSKLDPEGESFRYPVSAKRNGSRSSTLPEDLLNLDIGALVTDGLKAIDLLSGAEAGIDAYSESKAEMREMAREIEAEMRAEMEAEMRAEFRHENEQDGW